MPTAYSYIRFSTPEQAKGNSLQRQLQLSEDYARKHGLVLDRTFNMRDLGVSGFTRENVTKGALGVFLKAVQEHLIPKGSYLLVESLDRLSRAQLTEQMTMFMSIINEGITIVTLSDQKAFSRDSINQNMWDLMYSLMIMSRAYEESATKSKRVRAAWDNKRKQGGVLTALGPAWLSFDKDKRKFVPIPARAALVRRIFTMSDCGKGQSTITKTFNKERIPVWGRGNGWHSSYIQKILENRSVIGEYQPHHMQEGKRVPVGEPIANYFPAVVSKELVARVQAKRRSNRRFISRHNKDRVSNLFTGLAYCAYSGVPMVYVDKGKSWQYLVSDSARRGRGDQYQSWNYNHFETSFLTFIREFDYKQLLSNNKDRDAKLADMESGLLLKKDELASVEKKQGRLIDVLEKGGTGFDTIKDRITALERQKSDLEKQIHEQEEKLEDQKRTVENIKQAGANLKRLFQRKDDVDFRYQLCAEIRNQVERIDVYPGGFHWTKALSEKLFPKGSGRHDMLNRLFLHRLMRTGYITVGEEVRKHLDEHRRLPSWNDRLAGETPPPTDKKERLFIVFFKDGSGRLVKPDFNDPTQLAPVREERGGGVFDVGITSAGIMVAMRSNW